MVRAVYYLVPGPRTWSLTLSFLYLFPAVLEGGVKLRRAKMSHMGDEQYQSVGVDAKEKSLAELLVEQGDGLILAGGY